MDRFSITITMAMYINNTIISIYDFICCKVYNFSFSSLCACVLVACIYSGGKCRACMREYLRMENFLTPC
jgi:hypothetical protein